MLTKQFFDDIFPVSEQAFSELKKIMKPLSVKKDDVFINAGKRNNSEYIITEGFCRSFLVNTDGEEITLSFFKSKSVLSPHITRTKEHKSLINFQALTPAGLIEFDSEIFLSLMIEHMEIRNFGNTILLNELLKKTEKEISLVTHTAKERLKIFRSEFGILENLTAHPVIASYLGITNVSLSRLRSETMKG